MAHVNEINGLENPSEYHEQVTYRIQKRVPWTEPGLKITRLRLLSDYDFPMWDVSYCHGQVNGEPVEVVLPFFQLPKRGWKHAIVEYAKRDGVYAAGLGVFDNVSQLQ